MGLSPGMRPRHTRPESVAKRSVNPKAMQTRRSSRQEHIIHFSLRECRSLEYPFRDRMRNHYANYCLTPVQ